MVEEKTSGEIAARLLERAKASPRPSKEQVRKIAGRDRLDRVVDYFDPLSALRAEMGELAANGCEQE